MVVCKTAHILVGNKGAKNFKKRWKKTVDKRERGCRNVRLFKFAGRGIEICFERRRRERSLKGGKKTLKKREKVKKIA